MDKIEQIRRDSIKKFIEGNNSIIGKKKIYGYKITKYNDLFFKMYSEVGYYYAFIGTLDNLFAPSGNFKGI